MGLPAFVAIGAAIEIRLLRVGLGGRGGAITTESEKHVGVLVDSISRSFATNEDRFGKVAGPVRRAQFTVVAVTAGLTRIDLFDLAGRNDRQRMTAGSLRSTA